MLSRLSIRWRILIIFIVVAVIGGLVQFVIAGRQLEAATLEFYKHHLETDALLVSTTFAEPLGHFLGGEGEDGFGRMISTLQQEVGHDYLLVNGAGLVVAATLNTDYRPGDRIPSTPEFTQARSQRIGTDIRPNRAGEDTLYLAVAVQYEDNAMGYLVLTEPMQPAYADINRRYIELATSTLPVLALVIAASLWVSSTISRPVQHLRNSALQMASGSFDTRIAVHSQDEIGQLGDAFNYMSGQIESLMKTQRSFVSNAAHELRTPLMTLKLRAEALGDSALPEAERATYLAEIRQEIDHMAQLVSSLLLLARIDEGRHLPAKEGADVVSALHDIVRHWRIEAEAKGLAFSARIDNTMSELPISTNDLRLILDNLLANAIKYTPKGNVALGATQDKHRVIFEVRDTGIGFPPEQAEHLFERFYRAEEVRGRYGGNGLGLSIVKAILATYGGQISGESQGHGQGAAFTVVIDLHPTAIPHRSAA
jgi:signal transduction histidine kinase